MLKMKTLVVASLIALSGYAGLASAAPRDRVHESHSRRWEERGERHAIRDARADRREHRIAEERREHRMAREERRERRIAHERRERVAARDHRR